MENYLAQVQFVKKNDTGEIGFWQFVATSLTINLTAYLGTYLIPEVNLNYKGITIPLCIAKQFYDFFPQKE